MFVDFQAGFVRFRPTRKPSPRIDETTCEDILASVKSRTSTIEEQIKHLELGLNHEEVDTFASVVETSDLDSQCRQIADKIDDLSKAVDQFTNMYSATIRGCSSKQLMPKNISKLGPTSAALTKAHQNFKNSVNRQNEINFLAERILSINEPSLYKASSF